MSNKLLTIGMSTYDDYDGLFFTIQALRMYHPECNSSDIEFIVIDNNSNGKYGKYNKNFVENWLNGKYIAYTERAGTACSREAIFKHSEAEYTMCIDSHIMIESGGISSLLKYYSENPDTKNLIQGPLLHDDLKSYSTHFEPVWRDSMYGIWETDKEKMEKGEPFKIPMMGLGLFSCKTSEWAGFNKRFIGFGGEEGYIHEKFRKNGGDCLCLPSLKWNHRFARPLGVTYPNILEQRVWNYFLGWLEITQDPNHEFIKSIYEHFKGKIPSIRMDSILKQTIDIEIPMMKRHTPNPSACIVGVK